MGNLLISGYGKDVNYAGDCYAGDWAVTIGVLIGIAILGFILAGQFGYQSTWPIGEIRTPAYYLILWGCIIGAIVFFGFCAHSISVNSKTEIHVYENGIRE